jgi:hypothetical protein
MALLEEFVRLEDPALAARTLQPESETRIRTSAESGAGPVEILQL